MIPVLARNNLRIDAFGYDSCLALIDKDTDWTSFDVVNKIRRITGFKKAGHAGTLDPFATGLLLIGLGKATKELSRLSGLSKTYEASIRFGEETDTYDRTGQIVGTASADGLTAGQIEAAVRQMSGEIMQLPPMYSAKKIDGVRLYKLARKNQQVERPAVAVTIHEAQILSWEKPVLQIRLKVSKGCYIRSYAHDLGQALGCGAHVAELRRTAIDEFSVGDSLKITEFVTFWRNKDLTAYGSDQGN
jgi:tRNA pseudouridine55 synthase